MEKMEKLVKRDYYDAIISVMTTGETDIAPEKIIEFCEAEKVLLEKKAMKAKERAAKKATEADELYTIVEEVLSDEYKTIAEITAAVEAKDSTATTQKVTWRLGQLVENGVAVKKQITIHGSEGVKARKLQAYKLADET